MDASPPQIAEEQAYVDVLYARLDDLTAQVGEKLRSAQAAQDASTHQNRSERDAFVALYEDRLALLHSVADGVVFGRLDTDAGDSHHIGRIGLFTRDRDQLLVDWRAPAAAAFYQATAAERQGVRLRRHLITRGRTVVGLEDDVLDQSLLTEGGSEETLQGEGALLAAVTAQRTGRMGDIVATIQAEQDRIIRSDHRGVMVVQGGPGTGKTAVALHRAAYLLYTHRRRLEHTGVLIVAPTHGFLHYIERVLPSLGESGVVMLTPGELYPGIHATRRDRDEVAVIKGDRGMADLLARAVKDRQRAPEEDVPLRIDGTELLLRREDVRAAIREARASHRPHNAARAVFVRAALDRLVVQYEQALQAAGHTVVPEDRPQLLQDLRTEREVRVALNLAWMPYTPESFLRILLAHPERLRAAAPRHLQGVIARIARPKDSPWTVEDAPLLDELAELLGEDETAQKAEADRAAARRAADVAYARTVLENIDTSGIVRAEDLADRMTTVRDGRTLAERAAADRSWTYGHVVVDEAQEHSAMMWRALMRRCPTKSFTVVGDVAQTSSAAGTSSWQRVLDPYVEDRLHVERLTVNYRTPRRLMDRAVAVAEELDLPVTPVTSVREGEHELESIACAASDLAGRTADRVRQLLRQDAGRIAVIADEEAVPTLADAIRAAAPTARVGLGSAGVDDVVAVMTPHEAKGLEFDAVLVVEPAALLEHRGGAGDLYVALTRATSQLVVLHSREIPTALRSDAQ
ncbi:HelD family protein [Brachybacterium sillae]|uniref:HelD family protein n=1 Tax=Brachybacterium sillae TaxID=2810536 RepID=UPI00217E0F28|nr:ATP-binding domain-containing protein [Brachybacterium sillae]